MALLFWDIQFLFYLPSPCDAETVIIKIRFLFDVFFTAIISSLNVWPPQLQKMCNSRKWTPSEIIPPVRNAQMIINIKRRKKKKRLQGRGFFAIFFLFCNTGIYAPLLSYLVSQRPDTPHREAFSLPRCRHPDITHPPPTKTHRIKFLGKRRENFVHSLWRDESESSSQTSHDVVSHHKKSLPFRDLYVPPARVPQHTTAFHRHGREHAETAAPSGRK